MPSGTLSSAFTYIAPTTVLGVISSTGPSTGGKLVTVWGTAFRAGATVTFGGVSATDVVVTSANTIRCATPAHAAGAVTVVVTNTIDVYGSAGAGLNGTGTLASAFTYNVEAPTVIAVSLDYGDTAGGDHVIIVGTGFNSSSVLFGASSATSVSVISPNIISCVTPAGAAGFVFVKVTNGDSQFGTLYDGFEYEVTPFVDTKGWWASNEGFFGGADLILSPLNPQHPRVWSKIVAFATGNSGMLGGSPAASVMFRNHIIYAGDDYTLGTTNPSIRIFDGLSDRLMARMPNTVGGAVPKAIMSMLLVGDLVYFTSLDSGTSAADFAGRVFSFDPISNVITPIGSGFSSGEVPYTLAWHMNRLWVGTNKGNGTAGKIYFIRPDIDTDWTTDYTLTTSSVGGATSMRSFQGKLFIGTDNIDAQRGKVLARSTDGTYVVSETGSGGTAKVNNGYLAMTEFGGNLYASYWNQDTTAISKIRKFDGSSWTTAYTGATTTLRPFILLFNANSELYAVAGGLSLSPAVLNSVDGATWTNLSSFLTGPTGETALPMLGLVYT